MAELLGEKRDSPRPPRERLKKMKHSIPSLWILLGGLLVQTVLAAEHTVELSLTRRDHQGRAMSETARLVPGKTAIVVVDMWDRHWCKTYTARVANLVPRMNRTLDAVRQLGIQVVWAPSDVVGFYQEHPSRKAMQAIPAHPAPARISFEPPPAPTGDNCECGPDRPCQNAAVWTRQQPGLVIVGNDLIADCNNLQELLSLCAERGIDTLIYLGVASNMCVCYRSMGMINARRHGFRLLFVADLVESIMANGVDPVKRTPDPNFTPAKGTALVQRFLEQHVAPSIESRQLLAAAAPAAGIRARTSYSSWPMTNTNPSKRCRRSPGNNSKRISAAPSALPKATIPPTATTCPAWRRFTMPISWCSACAGGPCR